MMTKRIFSILIISSLLLTACGFQRDSNQPAKPETQLNNQDKEVPNTGNEEVNEENDVGIPKVDEGLNDPSFEKPNENNDWIVWIIVLLFYLTNSNGGEERMKNTMNAQFFMLEFLSTSCAITHENATNGIGLSIFSHFHSNTHSWEVILSDPIR